MPPSKNQLAATLTKGEASRLGVMDAEGLTEHLTAQSKRLYGFTRKLVPKDLPIEPKLYIYSISVLGEVVDLGPGFPKFNVSACPKGEAHGEPCVVDPIYFLEEAKVDVSEHTFHSGKQMVDAILKIGPGMQQGQERTRQGWFVSAANPPQKEDLDRAIKLYTSTCMQLVKEANRYASAGKLLEINETHYRAAEYLGEKVDWHKQSQKKVDCDGCGESILSGAMIHAVPYCGAIQGIKKDEHGNIIDPGRWADVIASGMRQHRDAPKEIQELLDKE